MKKNHEGNLKLSDNENISIENVWDINKALIRRKFIAPNASVKRRESKLSP